jgi:hypothetical protein
MEKKRMKQLGVVHTAVIPALLKMRQEGGKFEASLVYIERTCFKNKTKQKQTEGWGLDWGRALA